MDTPTHKPKTKEEQIKAAELAVKHLLDIIPLINCGAIKLIGISVVTEQTTNFNNN